MKHLAHINPIYRTSYLQDLEDITEHIRLQEFHFNNPFHIYNEGGFDELVTFFHKQIDTNEDFYHG